MPWCSLSMPPLSLSRLRARGLLTEIDTADLRFSADEAAQFLTKVMHLPLSNAEIAALDARTEGWITGLHLAALAMRGPIRLNVLAGSVAVAWGRGPSLPS